MSRTQKSNSKTTHLNSMTKSILSNLVSNRAFGLILVWFINQFLLDWQEMGAIPVVKEVREKRSLSKPKSLIDSAQDQKLADMYKINRSLTKLAGKANKLFDENEDDLTDNSVNLPSDLKSAIRRLKEELNQRTHIVFSFASPVYIPFKVKEQVLPQLNFKQEFEQIK